MAKLGHLLVPCISSHTNSVLHVPITNALVIPKGKDQISETLLAEGALGSYGELAVNPKGALFSEGVVAQWCNPLTLQPE